MLAAHFAAAAVGLHLSNVLNRQPRIEFLRSYLQGCLSILEGHKGLTEEGRYVANVLTAFSSALGKLDLSVWEVPHMGG
jgi:hypothetical protein